jgi:hypothetical protein
MLVLHSAAACVDTGVSARRRTCREKRGWPFHELMNYRSCHTPRVTRPILLRLFYCQNEKSSTFAEAEDRGINLLKKSSMNLPARSALRFADCAARRVHLYGPARRRATHSGCLGI